MRTISGSKIRRYASIVGIFLIIAALITGIPVSYDVGGDTRTLSDNLEIRTWYDLDAITDNLDGDHILMNDLDSTIAGYEELASPTANQGKGWEPIGFFGAIGGGGGCVSGDGVAPYWYGLTGTFDGQGYEIRDLFINRPDECHVSPMGLFGSIDKGGIIKNVGVVNVTVIGCEDVGGLVGWNGGTVSNSYSSGNVTGNWHVGGLVGVNSGTVTNSYSSGNVTGNWIVGGLVGYNHHGTLSTSYATGSVIGVDNVGGLAGRNHGTVSNSYSTGNVTGESHVGGLAGYQSGGIIKNSYSIGSVTGSSSVGGLVGHYGGPVSNSFWDTETSGLNTSVGGTGKNTTEMQDIITFSGATWNITTVGGIGERNITCIWNIVNGVTYPFLSWQSVKIRDWYDLDAIRNDLDGSYVLMNNLNSTTPGYTELASPTANGGKGWQPIGVWNFTTFTGTFNGKGYEVRDLFINRPKEYEVGLFGCVGEGGGGFIRNVGVVDADITGYHGVGALVGINLGGNISDSYSSANVTGNLSVGGLVGVNSHNGTVSNSYSTGKVTGSNFHVGGLIGGNSGTASNSYSTCDVTGDYGAGGLVGENWGSVTNCYATGSVAGAGEWVLFIGGLVGNNCDDGTVTNSYSTGSVTGNSSVGGLVAQNDGTVNYSFWDTQTSGQNTSAGGTGKNTTEMQNILTFSGATWNITTVGGIGERNTTYIWNIVDSVTYPFLSWQPV